MSRSGLPAGRLIATLLASGSIVLTVAGTALVFRNGESLIDGFNLILVVVGVVYAAAGWLLRVRVPQNALGAVFLLTAMAWALALVFDEYATYALITAPGTVPGGPMAMWLAAWVWIPGTALFFFAMPMLFPDGHLPSARWRPVAAFVVAGTVMSMLGHALVVWPLRDTLVPLQPGFLAAEQPGIAGTLTSIGDSIMFLVAPPIAVVALVMRYRRSFGVAREQMRWLTFAIFVTSVVGIGSQLLNSVIPAANAVAGIAVALVPIALTAAILRYRLYDIDRIISRTLGWAIVTGLLVVVFAGLVVTLQAVLAQVTDENTFAVAASTLVTFALFQPLRRQVQRLVDRWFDRARYDGERLSDAFAERLRDQVDLGGLTDDLAATVDQALRPARSSLWLRAR